MIKNFTLLFASIFFSIGGVLAQTHDKCAAQILHEKAKQNDPSIALKEAYFEALQVQEGKDNVPTKAAVITIPIVFHIIHNGEAAGTGNNVSDAIVMYQLSRINEDYRAMNSDALAAGDTFFSDQADMEIEFCLATVDEDGNSTSGITRHNMMANEFTIQEIDSLIKPVTIWDHTSYVNFWCVNIQDPTAPGVDGYGTFPTSTTDSTDGIVVQTNSFGYINGTDKSITATHELGHYFNLIHIWGDATCGDDMVSDTPPAEMDNSGCPTVPHNVGSTCNPGADGEMFMNYMDYTDAECVVMFSNGQKTRVLSAINTFRSSLTTSNGCASTQSIAENNLTNKSFSVYPNPNNGSFVLDVNQANLTNISMKVYDHVGKEVTSLTNIKSFPHQVNLEDFEDGVYFVQLNNENNSTTLKVSLVK